MAGNKRHRENNRGDLVKMGNLVNISFIVCAIRRESCVKSSCTVQLEKNGFIQSIFRPVKEVIRGLVSTSGSRNKGTNVSPSGRRDRGTNFLVRTPFIMVNSLPGYWNTGRNPYAQPVRYGRSSGPAI